MRSCVEHEKKKFYYLGDCALRIAVGSQSKLLFAGNSASETGLSCMRIRLLSRLKLQTTMYIQPKVVMINQFLFKYVCHLQAKCWDKYGKEVRYPNTLDKYGKSEKKSTVETSSRGRKQRLMLQ